MQEVVLYGFAGFGGIALVAVAVCIAAQVHGLFERVRYLEHRANAAAGRILKLEEKQKCKK